MFSSLFLWVLYSSSASRKADSEAESLSFKEFIKEVLLSIPAFISSSSFFIFFSSSFTYDYSYINQVESFIDFELPDAGKITTYNYGNVSDSIGTKKESGVIFLDQDEINNLNLRINTSNKWTNEITSINLSLLPKYQQIIIGEFDYFIIYNITLDSYNSFPNTSGTFDFLFIAYNVDSGQMRIIEYRLEITI